MPATGFPDDELRNCGCSECRQALADILQHQRPTTTAPIDPEPPRKPEARQAIRVRLYGRTRVAREPGWQREYKSLYCPSCEYRFYVFVRATGNALCPSCNTTLTFEKGMIRDAEPA